MGESIADPIAALDQARAHFAAATDFTIGIVGSRSSSSTVRMRSSIVRLQARQAATCRLI